MLKIENPVDVRGDIMNAARDLFIRKGFKGTTVRDIAAASGTNVAMVNYYFQSKHKLFEEIFNEALDILSSKVFGVIDSDLPVFQMVEKWITVYYDLLFEYPELPLFVLNELSQHPGILKEKIESKQPFQMFMRLANKFEEETKAGIIRPVFSVNFILTILSLCMYPFVFSPIANSFLELSKEEYNEVLKEHKSYVIDFIIHAIRGDKVK